MKKIFLLIATLAFFITGCSLDERRQNALDIDSAIQSPEDLANMANYMNIYLRAYSAGSYVYIPEIASDLFNPNDNYGNRQGGTYRWQWDGGSSFNAYWAPSYYAINHSCFVIEKAGELDMTSYTPEQIASVNNSLGIAYFTKAYFGLKLLEYYCLPYSAANAGTYGIMLIDLHRPSGDIASYPGRSTLQESYDWVISNLNEAEHYLAATPGAVGSTILTIDAVHALQARLALEMGDWDLAISKSKPLVDGGKYPLINTLADMTGLWTNDNGKECIVQMWADLAASSLPSSNDPGYHSYNAQSKAYTPDWIANKYLISLYGPNDIRYKTWFEENIKVSAANGKTGVVTLFNKFPGNPALQPAGAATSSHLQKVKLFRIAEQYLIAAEAYARNGADIPARTYLGKLITQRDASFDVSTLDALSGDALLDFILEERLRELVGEGFRWLDLRRWGKGMQRGEPQLLSIISTAGADAAANSMSVNASDYRWVGPIPSDERDANPQIRDQQNPGY